MWTESDNIEWLLPLLIALLCAPIVITTIAGILASMRRGTVHRVIGWFLGFVIGIMTTAGIVMLFLWIQQTPNPIIYVETLVGFSSLYAGCCTVGIIVTIALAYRKN